MSSRRKKTDVRDAGDYNISNLRVANFKYKVSDMLCIGLIAEEVVEILPDIVTYDSDYRPDAIRDYDLMFIMLQQLQTQAKKLTN